MQTTCVIVEEQQQECLVRGSRGHRLAPNLNLDLQDLDFWGEKIAYLYCSLGQPCLLLVKIYTAYMDDNFFTGLLPLCACDGHALRNS